MSSFKKVYSEKFNVKNINYANALNFLTKIYKKLNYIDFYKDYDSSDNTFNETQDGSSDERLGEYHSMTYGIGAAKHVTKDVSLNTLLATQHQSNGLNMHWIAFGIGKS